MLPAKILRLFQSISPNACESEYNGSYNKLLYSFFPFERDFVVTPFYLPDLEGDVIVMFEVLLFNKPVFIVEVNHAIRYRLSFARRFADDKIRTRMGDLVGRCPLETLHGICAFGTKLCFYSLDARNDNAAIVPTAIPQDYTAMSNATLESRWDSDILEASGEERFHAIVEEIKAGRAGFV
ncbi:hypothetical protein BDN70DRAFT_933135 [Pholiota conissans]|uniref:Uncharacterized protein n=1 Tax=Pholiota conissans TaxID=109636 RepID=A0A9P5Z2U6_9AGAR|nr:hypothetical protein BDN70DRAFT_933135 [Pholiota conissans]